MVFESGYKIVNEQDLSQITEAFHKTLDERDRMDKHKHREHHTFVNILIEERLAKKLRWERIRQQTYGWAIIVALGWVGTLVYTHLFKNG